MSGVSEGSEEDLLQITQLAGSHIRSLSKTHQTPKSPLLQQWSLVCEPPLHQGPVCIPHRPLEDSVSDTAILFSELYMDSIVIIK